MEERTRSADSAVVDGGGGSRNDGEDWDDEQRRKSGRALGVQQVTALLRRNVIERQRTKGTTFCELCSPILLLCFLVYGYCLSDVLVFPEKTYSVVSLSLPGKLDRLLPLLLKGQDGVSNSSLLPPSSPPTADPPPSNSQPPTSPQGDGDDPQQDGAGSDGLNFGDLEELFHNAKGLMDGPFPVPDLDSFVAAGSAVIGDLDASAYAEVLENMESGRTFGNLITQGTLHFAPALEPAVGELVDWLSNTTSGFDVLTHRVHESEEAAVAYALDHLEERTWAVIALDEADTGRVDYTIRMNFTVLPNTNERVDMIAIGLDPRFRRYYLSGFLTLQTTIDRFMFQRALPPATDDRSRERSEDIPDADGDEFTCIPPDFVGVPFPTAAYDQNLFYAAVGYLLGLAMTMSTMYPLSRLVKSVVEEKESRVRETMRIMGLRTWAHELSWWITGAAVFTFIAVSVSAMLSWTFLPLADGSLLLVFMLSFTLSEVGLALMVAAVFSKAKLASIAAPCVLFAGVLPRYIFYGSNRHEAPRSKKLASLLSPTAFTFGADFIADYEYAGVGAGWGNFSEGEYSLLTSIEMMFFDALLYSLLAWYLDKVVPSEYGTSHNPLRFLGAVLRSRTRRAANAVGLNSLFGSTRWISLHQDEPDDTPAPDEEAGERMGSGFEGDPGDFEPLHASSGGSWEGGDGSEQAGVVISGLRKEFGEKVAVVGLNLRLLPGDITCILGHNGAGKSTTISMLTGQLGATSGDAVVWGHSVTHNLAQVRQSIGICPQHDALMPLLTTREHVEMYMDIKGIREDLKGSLVTDTLREVGLLEKEHSLSSSLSGGQKRKLSVALALTGSPTLCILDEPTSGMDPYSRRFTWDLLRRGKAGRCTLLSTHFMEEAEHLGDRIAMLGQGRLRCCGSPLFLKSRFGLGYKLTLVKASDAFDQDTLTKTVANYVPTAQPLSCAGGEISFRLPREVSAKFPGLFRELETQRAAMGVGGYGVSVTSLEEVFLSLESERHRGAGSGVGNRDAGYRNGGRVVDGMVGSSTHAAAYTDMRNADGTLRQGTDGTSENGVSNGPFSNGTAEACSSRSSSSGSMRSAGANGRRPDMKTTGLYEIELQSMDSTATYSSQFSSGGRNKREGGNEDRHRGGAVAFSTTNGISNRRLSGRRDCAGDQHENQHKRTSRIGALDFEEEQASLLAETQEDDEGFAFSRQHAQSAFEDADAEAPAQAQAEGVLRERGQRRPRNGRHIEGQGDHAGVGIWAQLGWLLWKRRVVAMRDWRGGLYQVLLPALLVALVLLLLTIDVGLAGPSLAMSAAMFGEPTQVLFMEGDGPGPRGDGPGLPGDGPQSPGDGPEPPGRRQSRHYARVAEGVDDWIRLDPDGSNGGRWEATSTGLSQFLLDTYNADGDDAAGLIQPNQEPSRQGGDAASQARLPRYGAFVFGDHIPVNLTVNWDAVKDTPVLFGKALEAVGDLLPPEGGEYDLKDVLEATGIDEEQLAKMVLNNTRAAFGPNGDDNNFPWRLSPEVNKTLADIAAGQQGDFGRDFQGNLKKNWTEAFASLEDEDPTFTFTEAEYLRETSQLRLEGVVFSAMNRTFDIGEVVLSVDDVVKAIPPGTRDYDLDAGALDANGTHATVMFNTTAPHALGAWVGELTSKMFQACAVNRGLEEDQVSFTTRSHPLPLTATESLEVQTMLSLLVSLLVTIPLCYAPAAFVTFLVRERASKSKRVQFVSGASPLAYWLSAYLWDVLLFIVLTVLVMLAFLAYGRDSSRVFIDRWDAFMATWGLLASYGLSALPLSYLYSFLFDGPSAAQISIAGFNFLSGFGFVIAYGVLSSLTKTMKFAAKAQHVFRLFPPYLLGDGLIKVSSEYYMREVMHLQRSPWGVLAWDVAGMGITYMCLQALAYLCMVLVVEYSLAAEVRAKLDQWRLRMGGWTNRDLDGMLAESRGQSEDADVRAERTRVSAALAAGAEACAGEPGRVDTILIQALAKVYPAPVSSAGQGPKKAVRGLSLGVRRGECFGLLGINGAGKSTTLQILTRDLQATSGAVTIDGKAISDGSVCRLLGYCPQTDPLLDLMTVHETLLLYGGLKGVGSQESVGSNPLHDGNRGGRYDRNGNNRRQDEALLPLKPLTALKKAATDAMSAVSLGATGSQLAGTLSGGNKRKLSLAVALIGEPPVLLLDEPSSGMDPGARRSMWEVIASLSTSRSVILTTHSMEECEAVCSKLGIMVGGRLRCLGTSQHLKARFGGGYSIEVRCPSSSMAQVGEMITSLSPLARLDEMHPTLVKFSVPAQREQRQLEGEGAYGHDAEAGLASYAAVHGVRGEGDGRSTRRRAGGVTGGLSLAAAFNTIEERKEELKIWDYSISQATLETIFMSFAKDQGEEVASVPGVAYTTPNSSVNVNEGGGIAGARGHGDDPSSAHSMDVEMTYLGGSGDGLLRGGR